MIKIKAIKIEEFRGIRSLELELDGENVAICGPNGTGKSGIVDAIEFCLTGNVTRLSGQGQGELSVKQHAPHVDHRESPERARVTVVGFVPKLGTEIVISRSVNNPRGVTINPDNADSRSVVGELQSHPEFALSRREIAKYIITQPSKRSEDVQTLLRLDHIGGLRKALNSYANSAKKAFDDAERQRANAESDLKLALNLDELDRGKVIEIANLHRKELGLQPLTELKADTSFQQGQGGESLKVDSRIIDKAVAKADMAAVLPDIKSEEPVDFQKQKEVALEKLNVLQADLNVLSLARLYGFVKTGLDLVVGDECPLCDNEWDAEELRLYLKEKLSKSKQVEETLAALNRANAALNSLLEGRKNGIRKAIEYAGKLGQSESLRVLESYMATLDACVVSLREFSDDYSKIENLISAWNQDWWKVPAEVGSSLDEINSSIEKLPDTSAKDKAIAFLALLQERYRKLIYWSNITRKNKNKADKSKKAYEHYNTVSNSVLEDIYDSVANEFTELYRAINDDEGEFKGNLKAEPAKLSFNVDFYGRGPFPPGAYHSEGHQDGMGLCLYLALMKHTLGDDFTFAVLDDVLMSVDTGHRREVCRLLKSRFPNTQFILTTHDRVWLQYMRSEGLIQKGFLFGGWSVEAGPRIWSDTDVWAEIDACLERDDVPSAAALLRRYLEYSATVLADNLRAKVEYRGDASYDLGDLMPAVLSRWVDRLKKGIKSAKHWGHSEVEKQLEDKLAKATALIKRCNAEQWATNKSIHFNEWANFTTTEFREVVDAYRGLLDHIRCSNSKCGGYPHLSPRKGASETLQCACGQININLKV